MRDCSEAERTAHECLIALVEAKTHDLRASLGALQLARSPEDERAVVNRAIGLLERMKIQLRAGRSAVDLSEEWNRAGDRRIDGADTEARLKHAALALIHDEAAALEAAGIDVVHEFSAEAL